MYYDLTFDEYMAERERESDKLHAEYQREETFRNAQMKMEKAAQTFATGFGTKGE